MRTCAHAHMRTTQVIANMSPSLQEEVTQKVHGVWLRKLLFLSGAEPGCLVRIALRMEPRVFAPTDVPEGGRLYVISTGIVLNYDGWNAQGRVLGEGRVTCAYTCVCIHTCMHTYSTRMHTCIHTYIHTCIHGMGKAAFLARVGCGGWRVPSSNHTYAQVTHHPYAHACI